jgi:hypothetical protein
VPLSTLNALLADAAGAAVCLVPDLRGLGLHLQYVIDDLRSALEQMEALVADL